MKCGIIVQQCCAELQSVVSYKRRVVKSESKGSIAKFISTEGSFGEFLDSKLSQSQLVVDSALVAEWTLISLQYKVIECRGDFMITWRSATATI